MARLTQSMLATKATELMSEGVMQQWRAGLRPNTVDLTSSWRASWLKEYGLSMRRTSRKFKCPLLMLEERSERGGLNAFRVHAAGVLLTRRGVFTADVRKGMSKATISLFVPCLLMDRLQDTQSDQILSVTVADDKKSSTTTADTIR